MTGCPGPCTSKAAERGAPGSKLWLSEGIPLITADQLLLRQSGGGILTLGLRQLYHAKLSGNADGAPYC